MTYCSPRQACIFSTGRGIQIPISNLALLRSRVFFHPLRRDHRQLPRAHILRLAPSTRRDSVDERCRSRRVKFSGWQFVIDRSWLSRLGFQAYRVQNEISEHGEISVKGAKEFRVFGRDMFVQELGCFEQLCALSAAVFVGIFSLDQRRGDLLQFSASSA